MHVIYQEMTSFNQTLSLRTQLIERDPRNESDNCSTMEKLIEIIKEDFSSIDPILAHLCLSNGNPMVIPFVPRLKDLRPNF